MGDIRMERDQLVGFAGVILLVIGVFLPIVHLPIVGDISYVANGMGDGWLVFIFAIISGGLIFFRAYPWVALPATLATGTCIFTLWRFNSLMSQIKDATERDLHDNPFAGLAQLAISSVGLEWGWAVLFLGIICLFVTAGGSLIWGNQGVHRRADFMDNAVTLNGRLAVGGGVLFVALLVIGGYTLFFRHDSSWAPPTDGAQRSPDAAPATQSPALAQMNEAVTLTVTKKDYLPSDIEAERYHDRVQFEFEVRNHTSKDIAGVKGTLEFRDMFDTPVKSLTLSLGEDIEAGTERTITEYGMDVNQFEDADQKLAVTDLAKLKATFVPEMIIFADGTKADGTKLVPLKFVAVRPPASHAANDGSIDNGSTPAAMQQAAQTPPTATAVTVPNLDSTVSSSEQTVLPAPSSKNVQPSSTSEPLPPGQVYGEQNEKARVVLRLRQPARILVQGPDGTLFINRTLKAGDSYRVPNFVGVTLTTSNAGAVEIYLDGTVVGLAGENNDTAEALSLDPQSIMDRTNASRSSQ